MGPVSQAYVTIREVRLAPMETIVSTSVAAPRPRAIHDAIQGSQGRTEIWHAPTGLQTWMPDYVASVSCAM